MSDTSIDANFRRWFTVGVAKAKPVVTAAWACDRATMQTTRLPDGRPDCRLAGIQSGRLRQRRMVGQRRTQLLDRGGFNLPDAFGRHTDFLSQFMQGRPAFVL